MNQEPIISDQSLAKLLRAGYSIYRIPPGYKNIIHKLKFGKWGLKWEYFEKFNSVVEAENRLFELLKDPKILRIK